MNESKTFHYYLAKNRWRTAWLMFLFPVMITVIVFSALYAFSLYVSQDFEIAVVSAFEKFVFLLPWVSAIAFLWVIIALRFGRSMILGFAGAKPIEKKDSPDLYRVVENLAIRSGISTPDIYLIEDESMNAFATGYSPKKAAVAITRGLLQKLSKSEVEAVMAHEIGHILHRDTRVMLIAITIVGIIQVIAEIIFRGIYRNAFFLGGKESGKKNGIIILAVIGILLLVWVISFFGAIFVQMGISRRREYMADAECVNLTRAPGSLISALQKISRDSRVEALDGKRSIAAMCIADPLEKKQSFFERIQGLFSSHPPIAERIRALESMNG
jgi:heat shock protein HtpX